METDKRKQNFRIKKKKIKNIRIKKKEIMDY